MDPYFYTDKQNNQQGPVDKNELTKHGVNQSTLVWRQGMDNWKHAGALSELAGLFPPPLPATTPPPVPVGMPGPNRNEPKPTADVGIPTLPADKIMPPPYIPPSQIEPQDQENNAVVYSGKANHFLNGESVGGNLVLYRNKIQFKSHSLNIQNHVLEIELSKIEEVNFYNTLGLVPNGLALKLFEGKTEKFVVYKRTIWKTAIENQRSQNHQ